MLKLLLSLALIVFLLYGVCAVIISEVELDPHDDCRDCTEWTELYSEEEINLSEYILENNKSKTINLSGIKSGYIAIDFGKQFLTNSGDKLILKKGNEIIDETSILTDTDNNDFTYQFCSSSWKFMSSTKGSENNCTEPVQEETTQQTQNETQNTYTSSTSNSHDTESDTTTTGNTASNSGSQKNSAPSTKTTTLDIINLNYAENSKDIKTDNGKESLKKNLALGGIVTFCLLFGGLFFLKSIDRRRKNEFR